MPQLLTGDVLVMKTRSGNWPGIWREQGEGLSELQLVRTVPTNTRALVLGAPGWPWFTMVLADGTIGLARTQEVDHVERNGQRVPEQ